MSSNPKRKSKPEVFMMRVMKGAFAPADKYTSDRLRERGYHVGDIVQCTFKKLNNPAFHRLLHRIGQLCAKNIEEFAGVDAHVVLKRLQYEANVWCDEAGVFVPNYGMAVVRFPKSLSFESMDDGERHKAALDISRHIAAKYWPSMTPEAIVEMAESMVDEV